MDDKEKMLMMAKLMRGLSGSAGMGGMGGGAGMGGVDTAIGLADEYLTEEQRREEEKKRLMALQAMGR